MRVGWGSPPSRNKAKRIARPSNGTVVESGSTRAICRKEAQVMHCIMESNQTLLKRLINRMAADVAAAATGILLVSDNVIDEFKTECAMLTFLEEKEN
jgi:hypothetical protein